MDIDKLPKWAKDKIECLQREVIILKKKLDFLLGKRKETNVYFEFPFDFDAKRVYLDERSVIFFVFKNNRKIRVMFLERNGSMVVDVNGDDALLVKPNASNAVYIKLES
jgi:hypothetical protein